MVKLLMVLMILIAINAAADKQVFSINDLEEGSVGSYKERQESLERVKTLGQQNGIELIDQTFLKFKVDGHEYPAIVLPNKKIAPAIVDASLQRKPACIDSDYRLHPGKFDQASQRVICDVSKASLLISEEVQQGSTTEVADQSKKNDSDVSDVSVNKYGKPSDEGKEEKSDGKKPNAQQKNDHSQSQFPHKANANKYGSGQAGGSSQNNTSQNKVNIGGKSVDLKDPDIYVPPIRTSSQVNTAQYQVAAKTGIRFGIRKGTWAKVKITRRISSADYGEIEMTLEETINGQYRDLSKGSVLFASKSYNAGTEKMEIRITNGLLPDNDEMVPFVISAYGYDMHKEAGLAGEIIRNRDKEVGNALNQGALTMVGSAAGSLPFVAGNPLSDGAEATTQALVNAQQQNNFGGDTTVIEVPPQTFYIQISNSL